MCKNLKFERTFGLTLYKFGQNGLKTLYFYINHFLSNSNIKTVMPAVMVQLPFYFCFINITLKQIQIIFQHIFPKNISQINILSRFFI